MRLFVRPLLAALAAALILPSAAAFAHELLDHPAPPPGNASAPPTILSQAPAGKWELISSIATGNPHSDLDFFQRNGETFASVGTLGAGPNGGGQTIIQLTDKGKVAPKYVAAHPSASCVVNEAAALGLQHDVESSPKGGTILNSFNPAAAPGEAKIIIDATDATGRCHDSMFFGGQTVGGQGIADVRGGLEIIDITNPNDPVEIGLTRHIGEAHTVNVDPKRPHIAYAITSDRVAVDSNGKRANETSGFGLDGFEVVDFRSCLNAAGAGTIDDRRNVCDPKVYRYRYPELGMVLGHQVKSAIFGCHELEIYPNDLLTCGGGGALPVFDMSGAFDDMGTPDDYTDDTPRGTPLPCNRGGSASQVFRTGAKVNDCVDGAGAGNDDLIVSKWLAAGAPSLEGVRHLGSVFHMGRDGTRNVLEDIDFNHEAELSASGNLLIATDERGGGVVPPGASCVQGNPTELGNSNGGVHFYRADKLLPRTPPSAAEADRSYARMPNGKKAIFRATPRTGAQASVCTAHVMQQIPGQNRIFMGWYSQGTQVFDFTENPDGTVDIKEAGHFIPSNANEWVSHIFKAQENPDGTFTYFGATGDFNLGERGRNAVDVYKVTLPAPPKPADGPGLLPRRGGGGGAAASTQAGAPECVSARAFRSASLKRNGRRLSFAFSATAPVTIDIFRQARGGRVTGERLVKRFRNINGPVRWNGRDRSGRRLPDGYYLVRFASRTSVGIPDERRFGLLLRNGRYRVLSRHERRDTCGLLRRWKLFRPVFGGQTNRSLVMSFRFGAEAQAAIVVRRAGGRVVRRFKQQSYTGGVLHRKRLSARFVRRLRRGQYTVTIIVRDGSRTVRSTLRATRL